ncbi:MAG: hypothetical protein ACOYD3_06930 [Kiritimatiellia bacterium]|jgi:hypothetical protein
MNSGTAMDKRSSGVKPLAWTAVVLLLAVLVVAALRMAGRRPPQEEAVAIVPPDKAAAVEQTERFREQQIAERMEDPVYREQLDAIVVKRRQLGDESSTLQAEIDAWRQATAATNAAFGAALEAWSAGRKAASATDAAAVAALAEQEQALEAFMAADERGAVLLARHRELEARRGALDEEARRTVGERIRRQIERPPQRRTDVKQPEVAQ